MTQNMEVLFQQIRQIIETKYTSKLPTEDQILAEAEQLRQIFSGVYPVSDAEFESIKKRLPEHILHSIGYADTLRNRDSDHQVGWYHLNENDGFFGTATKLTSKRNGVGLVPPFVSDKRITRFTPVSTDFNASVIRSDGLNLNDLKGTALFVVKKNKSVLNNL